jgi:hypothetical protein
VSRAVEWKQRIKKDEKEKKRVRKYTRGLTLPSRPLSFVCLENR